MSGLHIAGDKGTEIAIFENVFVDIGDNQSIENALSTFSSHMKNLSEIMRMSNNNTLLLFDEIGAVQSQMKVQRLAISILEELYFADVLPLRVRITEKLNDSQKCMMTL